MGSAQQNQLSVRRGRPVVTAETSTGGAPTASRARCVELDRVTAGLDQRRQRALERVDRGVGVHPREGRAFVVPGAEEGSEIGVLEEQRTAREQQPNAVLHGVDAADEIVVVHEVEQRDQVVAVWSTA